MRQVITQLEHVQRLSRALLLAQRVAVILASAGVAIMALIGLDYLLHLPGTARLVLLGGGLTGLVWLVWTYLRPAVLFRPSLTQMALRAEAAFPAVAGRLASSVEFATAGLDRHNELAARSVADTERRLAGETLSRVISGGRTWRATGGLLGVLAIAVSCTIVNPVAARTGLARLFAPFGATEWPALTGVVSLMDEIVSESRVHPRGRALPLRAKVTRGEPDYVAARYRLRTEGHYGPWHRIVLTDQGHGVHERLVDTTADGIELYFETWDYRSKPELITLAAPPAVYRATLSVVPPSYAAPWFSPMEADLGPGLDNRASTETPSLIGSDVTLRLELNKPIPAPQDAESLRQLLGWGEGDPPELSVIPGAPALWELHWRLGQTRSLTLELVDEYGLHNTETIAYRIDAAEDRPPTVTIMQPESDEPVLPTARVPVTAEARDDVAVASMGLEASLQRHDEAGPQDQPVWLATDWTHAPSGTLSSEIDLAALKLTQGDTVYLRGTAEDVFELDGLRHAKVRSPARRLAIIDELDLARRFRRDLGVIRQNAIRIEARQEELEDEVTAEGAQPGMERAQAQVVERIAAQRSAIESIQQRMDMNRLQDDQLASLVGQSGTLLDFAGRAANRAAGAIEQRRAREKAQAETGGAPGAARPPRAAPPDAGGSRPAAQAPDAAAPEMPNDLAGRDDLQRHEPAEADRDIVDAQREVREELADLITLLDRDEDTWVATRRLEELARAQGEIKAETTAAGQRTLGRSADELTSGEQQELQRLAERQSDLAEQARQMIEDLRRRAAELEEADPQGAGAMRTAADRGEQRELSRDMESASQRVAQNQMRTAGSAQQAAGQTLQQMLQDIKETARANAEELLRRLASLKESIDRLIRVQESEMEALDRSIGSGDFSGRDRGMIRLAQNTQSVAGDARAAGQESRPIARLLERAADAQGAAVLALREQPVAPQETREAEARSLDLLREARELAGQLEQAVEQRELMRQRGELVAAYRELAEKQVAVRSDTVALADRGALDRRGLIEARGLGRNQEEIRVGLDDVRAGHPEIMDSIVFLHVHERMDAWSRQVTDSLVDGDLSPSVTDRQQRIADSIGCLIKAMESLIAPPDKFAGSPAQGGSGGGGGGGQGEVIPPVSELMLLRGMQEQVYQETVSLDRRGDLEAGESRSRLSELGDDQRQLLDLGHELARKLQRAPAPAPDSPPQ